MARSARVAVLMVLAAQVAGIYIHKKEDMSDQVIREHSFSAPFLTDWWQGGVPHWELMAGAVITDDAVRLTGAQYHKIGGFINTAKVAMTHWEARIKFRIHGPTNPGGDGMVLWYTDEPPKKTGPLYGMNNNFKGWGLVFDTMDNNGHRDQPSVTMLSNPKGESVRWDKENDFQNTLKFKCPNEFRNARYGEDVVVRVIYRYKKLEVFIKLHGGREYFCGHIEHIVLPNYYFSITASTSNQVDFHDVSSFVVTAAPGVHHEKPAHENHVHDPHQDARDREKWGYSDE